MSGRKRGLVLKRNESRREMGRGSLAALLRYKPTRPDSRPAKTGLRHPGHKREDCMIKRFVFLYDSIVRPWHADLRVIQKQLTEIHIKCELLDTKDIPEEELEHWRIEATKAAVKHHQQIRQVFGSRRKGGLQFFGKQVPALLVYEEGEKLPVAIYPHSEKRGEKHTDFSIESFLGELMTLR